MANVVAVIAKIEENSLAEELGLEIGDKILEINGQNPLDLIDYQILWANEEIELLIKNQSSEQFFIPLKVSVKTRVVFEQAIFIKCEPVIIDVNFIFGTNGSRCANSLYQGR